MKKLMTAMLLLCAAMWNVALAQTWEKGEALITTGKQIINAWTNGEGDALGDGNLSNRNDITGKAAAEGRESAYIVHLRKRVSNIIFSYAPRQDMATEDAAKQNSDAPHSFSVYVSSDGKNWSEEPVHKVNEMGGVWPKETWFDSEVIPLGGTYEYVKLKFHDNWTHILSKPGERWNFSTADEKLVNQEPNISLAEVQFYEANNTDEPYYVQGESLISKMTRVGGSSGWTSFTDGNLGTFSEFGNMDSKVDEQAMVFTLKKEVSDIYFTYYPRNQANAKSNSWQWSDAPQDMTFYVAESADGPWKEVVALTDFGECWPYTWYTTDRIHFDAATKYVKIKFTKCWPNTHYPGTRWYNKDTERQVPYISVAEWQFYEAVQAGTTATLTWIAKDKDGNELTRFEEVVSKGTEVTAYPAALKVNFATLPALTPFTVTEDTEIPVVVEWNNFITIADKVENATWYRIRTQDGSGESFGYDVANNKLLGVNGNGAAFSANEISYYWAFVSDNPFQGVKVYNMAAYVRNKNAVLASDGNNNWVIVDETDYDASTYNTNFRIYYYGTPGTGRFNWVDYKYISPSVKKDGSRGWVDLSKPVGADGYINGWGQYCRIVERAADEYQDPSKYDFNRASEFNSEVLPWIEDADAGKLFHLKAATVTSINSAYEIEALKTYCDEDIYKALKAIVADQDNFVMPETGYYRLQSTQGSSATTLNSYLGYGWYEYKETYKFAQLTSSVSDDHSAILKVTNNGDGTYGIQSQGYYLKNNKTGDGYCIGSLDEYKVRLKLDISTDWHRGKAAIWVANSAAGELSSQNFLLANTSVWHANRNDAWWAFEDATDAELNVALNSIGSETYATLCVPYPYSLSEGTTAYAMELSPSGKEGVYYADLNAIEGIVPAGTPVVLISGEGSNQATLTVNPAGTAAEVGTNVLTGNYLPLTWDAEDLALGRYQDGGNYIPGFYKWSGTTLGANKAYIKADDLPKAGVREIVFRNGETTGIGTALSGSPAEAQGAVYDLQGRRTQAKQPGLYIVNGKKVFIK